MNQGVFKSEFITEDSKLIHRTTQPTEDMILARNARLRQNPGAINDLGKNNDGGTWGRWCASIPMIVYDSAIRNGFDLNSKDAKVAAKEMSRFLATPIGKACLVQDNDKKYHLGGV